MAWGVPVISSNSGGLSEVNLREFRAISAMLGIQTKMAENALKILKDSSTLLKFKENALCG
jgi:hypothetical protein